MQENLSESFENSSIIITGASRGIGQVIATTFARETSHPLILIARSKDALEETKSLCKEVSTSEVYVISCDLTDEKSVKNISLPGYFLQPGIIINNAGSFLLKPLAQTNYNQFLKQIQDNLFSAVNMVDRFSAGLHALNRALIINICSAGSLEGLKDSGAYASSKHALLGYTRSLRKELLDTNVAVTALNLGQTQSTSWKGSSVNPQKLIDPQDVADLLVAISKLSPRSVVEELTLKPQHGRVPPM